MFTAIVAGCVAGVLGLTNVLGLLSYLVAMLLVRARLHTGGAPLAKSVVVAVFPSVLLPSPTPRCACRPRLRLQWPSTSAAT